MIIRSQFSIVAALAILVPLPSASLASLADLGPADFQACAPAPQFSQVVGAVAPLGRRQVSSLRQLSSLSVSIEGSAGRYRVQSGSAAPVTIVASVDAHACQAVDPKAVRLLNGGTIPGSNAAAVAAVLAFRDSHTWPYGGAHIDDPRTQIGVRARNGRVMVSIVDFKTLYSPNAFSCAGEEYYRVDLQTFEVRAFDGCVEGAPPKRLLPRLKELP